MSKTKKKATDLLEEYRGQLQLKKAQLEELEKRLAIIGRQQEICRQQIESVTNEVYRALGAVEALERAQSKAKGDDTP